MEMLQKYIARHSIDMYSSHLITTSIELITCIVYTFMRQTIIPVINKSSEISKFTPNGIREQL